MTTSMKTAARLVGALALVSAVWACHKAGDAPGVPTGPTTQYNPQIDYPGATISVHAVPDTMAPGEGFDLVATFTDAEGRAVVGVPLGAQAEGGNLGPTYFSFVSNPTVTGSDGHASIGVNVASTCPNESFTFGVFSTAPGPSAHGIAEIHVRGTGAETISKPDAPTGNTSPPSTGASYTASGAVSNLGHALEYKFIWGDGTESGWVPADTSNEANSPNKIFADPACGVAGATTATYQIKTKARCAIDTSIVSPTSSGLTVTRTIICP